MSFRGEGGLARAYGQQDLFPGSYAQGEVWTAELELKWTLFDGARREYQIAQAKSEKKAAQAELDALRDQISDEVWASYSNMRTALRQQQAAAALLARRNNLTKRPMSRTVTVFETCWTSYLRKRLWRRRDQKISLRAPGCCSKPRTWHSEPETSFKSSRETQGHDTQLI